MNVTIEAKQFQTILKQLLPVTIAASYCDTLLLDSENGIAVGTDGRALIIVQDRSLQSDLVGSRLLVKSKKLMGVIATLTGKLTLTESNGLVIRAGKARFHFEQPQATFPDYQKWLELPFKGEFRVRAEDMANALKRMAPMVDEQEETVRLMFSASGIGLQVGGGAAEDQVDVESTGLADQPEARYFLPHNLLRPFFDVMKGEKNETAKREVVISVNSPSEPVRLSDPAGMVRMVLATITKGA